MSNLSPKDLVTLHEVATCANGWTPEACLVGNVRAGDIVTAINNAVAELDRSETKVARLAAERDWLATQLACIQSAYDIDQKTRDWSTERWAEAARKAVAAGEG